MKKIILLTFLIILISGCMPSSGIYLVSDGETLPSNVCKNIQEKNIVIHRKGCLACAKALPILNEIEFEHNIKIEYYDLAVPEEREKLLSMNFTTQYVPTLISNCKAYVGIKSKENYLQILENG